MVPLLLLCHLVVAWLIILNVKADVVQTQRRRVFDNIRKPRPIRDGGCGELLHNNPRRLSTTFALTINLVSSHPKVLKAGLGTNFI